MLLNCTFSPSCDVERVVPNLDVDISEMMASGVVPSTGDTSPYTKETDINKVGSYLRDKIQTTIAAIRLNQSVAAAVASQKESVPSSTPEGA